MAQEDYVIANQAGAAFRTDLNNHLLAIVSNNSGATAPATTFAYQWWADTTTGLLKIRNAANSAWVTVGTLASANFGLAALASPTFSGTVTIPTLALTNDLSIANGGTGQSTAAAAFAALKQAATTTATGVVELADNTEALAGTDTTRAITSAGLASGLLAGASGYFKFPGGLLVQWGSGSINGDISGATTINVTYPIAFPSVVYVVIPVCFADTNVTNDMSAMWYRGNSSLTFAQFFTREITNSLVQSNWGVSYIAIGK
jgi:hypothetical protein